MFSVPIVGLTNRLTYWEDEEGITLWQPHALFNAKVVSKRQWLRIRALLLHNDDSKVTLAKTVTRMVESGL
jgi:hypothetical protein